MPSVSSRLSALCLAAVAIGVAPATAIAAPNLIVTGVAPLAASTGDAVRFSATVKNIGSSATPSGVIHGVRFSVDGVTKSWSDSSSTSLAAGATRTLVANGGPTGSALWTATSGSHVLQAWVDDVDRIAESSNSDNKLGATLNVGASPANLVVSSINTVAAAEGEDVQFSATIKNVGGSATPSGVIHGVRFSVDGVTKSWSDSSSTSLAAGATRTLVANGGPAGSASWTATSGSHAVEAWVDDVDRIAESSNSDNKLGATLNVAASPANLVVSSINAVAATEGDYVQFSATIKNVGGAATPSGVIHGVRFSVDGVTKSWADTSTASLAPGASRTVTANGGVDGYSTWAALAGSHTLDAWVDDVDRIDEQVETDNQLDMTFTVRMKPRVFAHWHHATQRAVKGYNTVDAYRAEVRKAKDMGIDGFAYNVINPSLELPEIDRLYEAANLEGDFYLFPSADLDRSFTDSHLDTIAYHRYNDPARLRMSGGRYGTNIPVMQTWHGQAKGTSYWKTRQDAWKASGRPMYFIPYFSPGSYSSVDSMFGAWDGSVSGQADDVVDGFYNFSGWASLTDPFAPAWRNHSYDLAADARSGMDAMFGCAPNFNRHSGTSDTANRIIGNFEGFRTYIGCLEKLVADNPRFIEFSTWNDYLEGTYLGGPYPREALWANYRGNEYSHDAFREIGAYYLEWFKTARKPQITKDLIAIAHRPHRKCAPGPHPGTDGSSTCTAAANDKDNAETRSGAESTTVIRPLYRQKGAYDTDDELYAAVILKSPGEVTLTSGSTTKTVSLPAGVSQVSMPFATGTQSIKLMRGGATVHSATSAVQVVAKPNLFNYNVATAHAVG